MPMFGLHDISINYQISGAGPRVLFFNGSGATLQSTELLIQSLSKECEVLAHDQRGLGLTSTPEGPYTMAQYASDAAALLDHVGWKTCAVIGISFGGMVAQEFAVTFPESVERLALLCTSAGGVAGSSYPLHELGALSADERASKMLNLSDTRFTPEWLASHPADAQMMNMRNAQASITKSAEVIRGERLQLATRAGHDVANRLHLITCRTFVTAGKFDGIAPPVNSEAIVERIPDATMSLYEGGHMFLAQDPTAIRQIRTFLSTGVRPGNK
ncbi:MAG: alpha/beta hydrolase [Acidimicrobium sp.]|nr:alpha/beta fold hydrolase [Ilumatobacteraceae bacterium]PHX72301.1 MAG: alpha/beta hydrolase [Acidimicrobium sp.]